MKEYVSVNRIRLLAKDTLPQSREVVALYLFGSILIDGKERKPNDIDLAFLLDEAHYKEDPLDASSNAHLFAARLSETAGMKTDVVILNGASIEMAYEIVARGRRIYAFDEDRVVDYECKIKGMYFDFRPFLGEIRNRSKTKARTGEP
jgi:predicted nucleotidyltransferase